MLPQEAGQGIERHRSAPKGIQQGERYAEEPEEEETTDDEEEYARRMAARDALKAKYLEEELPDDEKKIRDGLISYYREMYGQYGDDSFPEPDVLYGLSIEEIEELIDDLEEAEVAFELEYEKKRKS